MKDQKTKRRENMAGSIIRMVRIMLDDRRKIENAFWYRTAIIRLTHRTEGTITLEADIRSAKFSLSFVTYYHPHTNGPLKELFPLFRNEKVRYDDNGPRFSSYQILSTIDRIIDLFEETKGAAK